MGLDAVLMMTAILLLVWVGFGVTLIVAMRQERGAKRGAQEEGDVDDNAHA